MPQRKAKPFALKPRQIQILGIIEADGGFPMSRQDICRKLKVHKRSGFIAPLLGAPAGYGRYPDSLLERGFVQAIPTTTEEGRPSVFYVLTEKGAEALQDS